MELATCRSCKRIFSNYRGDRICPDCKKALEEKFAEVKKYVNDNPGISINQLATDMDISIKKIRQWIREERLVFSEESAIGIECISCGATIRSGRLCEKCKKNLADGFKAAENGGGKVRTIADDPKKKKTGDKMRFLKEQL